MAFVFVYSLISILVFTCGCIPVTAMWDMTQMATAKCVDQLAFVYANAAFNLLSDLMTLILPVKLCWALQTTLKQKVLLCVVLAMGSFACVIAIVRIVTMMPFVHSMDFTWYKVTLAKWAYVFFPFPLFCRFRLVGPMLMNLKDGRNQCRHHLRLSPRPPASVATRRSPVSRQQELGRG